MRRWPDEPTSSHHDSATMPRAAPGNHGLAMCATGRSSRSGKTRPPGLPGSIVERRDRRTRTAHGATATGEARLPRIKTLEEFDFSQSPKISVAQIRALAEGDYIRQAEPVLFIGECGTGQTHLMTGLCVAACRQKRREGV